MQEWEVMSLLVAGPALWMAGGTFWHGFRRIIWPLVVTAVAIIGGVIWWHALLAGLLVAGTASLPYGDSTPYPIKVLVFGSLAIPALAISINLWPAVLIVSAILTGIFIASQKWQAVTWKLWEGLAGFAQAGVIVVACLWK